LLSGFFFPNSLLSSPILRFLPWPPDLGLAVLFDEFIVATQLSQISQLLVDAFQNLLAESLALCRHGFFQFLYVLQCLHESFHSVSFSKQVKTKPIG
jgi:hypothetical protein